MKIEGVPDGWELVRIGRPDEGEFYLDNLCKVQRSELLRMSSNYPIVKQIEPPKPTYIPWTRDTCPIGSVVVGPIDNVQITRCNKESCYLVSTGYVLFGEMLQSAYRHNGEPCGTKV